MKKALCLLMCLIAIQSVWSQEYSIQLDTVRKYRLHLPDGYDESETYPLLLAFHGGFGFHWQFELETNFSDLADTANIIVAYPQALGTSRSWNTGSCCGWAFNNDIDDIDFVDHLLDTLIENYSIDEDRIYSTGFSSGAMLSYALGCKLSERIAAIAPVSSSMVIDECPVECLPIPVMHIHAIYDSSALFYGGVSENPLLDFYYPPVDSVLEVWSYKNDSREVLDTVYLENGARNMRWFNEDDEALVELWFADDGGHKWPGTEGVGVLSADSATQDFYATELVWKFLRKFSNDCSITASISEVETRNEVSVYPNPGHEEFTVLTPSGDVPKSLLVFNLNGDVVLQTTNKSSLSIGSLERGTYLIQVIMDGEVYTEKFIKQ